MIKEFRVSGSHFEVGLAIGKHFAQKIRRAFEEYTFLHEKMRAFHRTIRGEEIYMQLLNIHQETFPGYMQEIEGIAQGANLSLEDVFLVNMRGEYRGFIQETEIPEILECSDCTVFNETTAVWGHNEDGSPAFREGVCLIHADILGGVKFTACTYPGFLPGNAFGFNANGIAFSVDNISPSNIRPGLSRHFLARSILDAESLDDAIDRAAPEGRASGFTYTIGSIPERRIVQVEVAPDDHHIKAIDGPNFHTNHILNMDDPDQDVGSSSAARLERAREVFNDAPPENAGEILALLGDRANKDFPIYRTASGSDDLETYCTALFDLDARKMTVYHGHPVDEGDRLIEFNM